MRVQLKAGYLASGLVSWIFVLLFNRLLKVGYGEVESLTVSKMSTTLRSAEMKAM